MSLPECLEPERYRAAVAAARRAQLRPLRGRLLDLVVLDTTEDGALALVQASLRLGRNQFPSDFEHGTLLLDPGRMGGTVLAVEEGPADTLAFTVSFGRKVENLPDVSRVSVFPYDHLGALASWARELQEVPGGVRRLLEPDCLGKLQGRDLDPSGLVPLDPRQRRAVELASRRSLLLWGPPGTGKTHTLASGVAAMRREGWRVAVVALSNAAVDVATLAIDDACERLGSPLEPGELVRLGTPRHPELEGGARPHLLAFQRELAELNRKLSNARRTLAATVRKIREATRLRQAPPPKALQLRATLLQVIRDAEARRRALTRRYVDRARILCTTAASFIALGRAPRMDALLVDEGSQMPLALLYYLAAQEPKRLHVAGDPMQLPPILPRTTPARGRTREDLPELFGTSRFALAGLDPASEEFPLRAQELEGRDAMVALLAQRRMAPEIGSLVSRLAYRGRLENAAPEAPAARRAGFLPAARLVHVVGPAAGTATSSSEQAEVTRRVVLALTSTSPPAPGTTEILVLTPYRKQERILIDLLEGLPGVRVLTIHKAQGSEAPVVVLDVPAPRNRFLDNPDTALLLWNVAISRARHRLVLVAPRSVRSNRWAGKFLHEFEVVAPPSTG